MNAAATAKRILDLAIVVGTSPAWLPLLAAVALAVRIKLGRPVLFRQERAGLHGRPFAIVKFRSMAVAPGALSDAEHDRLRLSPFGRRLRNLSLDELPSLYNVVVGDMSLVGPRPLLLRYVPRYSATQARRHEVKPGVTGWAQLNGRNDTTWAKRLELDVWYVDHRSFRLDLVILFRTLLSVTLRRGVEPSAGATMPEFTSDHGERLSHDSK